MNNRGVLLHLTCVPNKLGVGDLGKSAYNFVDFLHKEGFTIWSMLPLTETNQYHCPYGSQSSYGFEIDWIDLEEFVKSGQITNKQYKSIAVKPHGNRVNLTKYRRKKKKLFDYIYSTLTNQQLQEIEKTLKSNNRLFNFCLFKSLLEHFKTRDWRTFEAPIRDRNATAIDYYSNLLHDNILKYAYFQTVFIRQFESLKKYANSKNIELWGDLPIYLEVTAFDIWENPKLVQLDKNYKEKYFGGVPADGVYPLQNWHTCIYNWDENRKCVFAWWKNRIQNQLKYFDKVRLDHYIGLINCYKIPNNDTEEAAWHNSGGMELFEYLLKDIDKDKIFIEDIGTMSKQCKSVRNKLNLVGMGVLQNAFIDEASKVYLPNKIRKQSIYYCGTHDNNTIVGFLNKLDKTYKQELKEYYNITNKKSDKEIAVIMINSILNSKTKYKLFQLQDLLLKPTKCRMNCPGTADKNWNYVASPNYKKVYNKNKVLFNL